MREKRSGSHLRGKPRRRIIRTSPRWRPKVTTWFYFLLFLIGASAFVLSWARGWAGSRALWQQLVGDLWTPHVTCPFEPGQEDEPEITTKLLYDNIPFENEEGGVWRQGWELTYEGNEWDEEPLRIFVVPHSHNDPGWLHTVEEYYQQQTKQILNTIVHSLQKDPMRRFVWEEMSYLQRWWQDADAGQQEAMRHLVASGQLEIVGGGWVMNDEANSHFYAIIDQIIEGNTWLYDEIGAIPRASWAIDPFGHSPTMAYLLSAMGFDAMLIQRAHYETKKALAASRSLEFWWRQQWVSAPSSALDVPRRHEILCHLMPFYSYDVPHTCGPDPSICCKFDFWRDPRVASGMSCPWNDNPEVVNSRNVANLSLLLLDQYRKKSLLFATNVLLVPLGDDFRYSTTREAEYQLRNYKRIFQYINRHPKLKANASFGTLSEYFAALRASLARKLPPQDHISLAQRQKLPLPTISGDFFTYSDVDQDYWSGFFSSRPFWKAVDRVLEATLRAAEIIFTLARAHQKEASNSSAFPFRYAGSLTYARRQLALFQHHDGVTGTAKDHVVEDYGMRLHDATCRMQVGRAPRARGSWGDSRKEPPRLGAEGCWRWGLGALNWVCMDELRAGRHCCFGGWAVGSGLRAPASGLRPPGSGLRAPASGLRPPGSGLQAPGRPF